MTALTIPQQRSAPAIDLQAELVPCHCTAWRHRQIGDHLNHRATLARLTAAGRVPDDLYFAAVAIESRLELADVAP